MVCSRQTLMALAAAYFTLIVPPSECFTPMHYKATHSRNPSLSLLAHHEKQNNNNNNKKNEISKNGFNVNSKLQQSNSRRKFLEFNIGLLTSSSSAGMIIACTSIIRPPTANASYGDSSKIVLPNYIEYLIEKNKQIDPDSVLYKGPDIEVQLRRIGDAAARLPEVAVLAEEKKWSQVQGIITGPLGTLVQTMNTVSAISGTKAAKDAAKDVKTDLIEIGVAAGRKDSASCVKAAGKAERDLEKFVMVAFK